MHKHKYKVKVMVTMFGKQYRLKICNDCHKIKVKGPVDPVEVDI